MIVRFHLKYNYSSNEIIFPKKHKKCREKKKKYEEFI